MDSAAVKLLLELGLTPVDWVSDVQFSKLTGIPENKLSHRRKKWPEDLVWTKQDGNIYYSVRGYNKWLTNQAEERYRRACGLETGSSASTGNTTKNNTSLTSRTPRLRKVSRQPITLELT